MSGLGKTWAWAPPPRPQLRTVTIVIGHYSNVLALFQTSGAGTNLKVGGSNFAPEIFFDRAPPLFWL